MKLKSHLFLLTAATLLPMIIAGVIASVFFVRQERAVFERGATERTRALLTAMDTELKRSITTLAALASSRHLGTGDLSAFHDEAVRVLGSQPDWTTITLASPSGRQIVDTGQLFGAKLPMAVERTSFERTVRTGKPTVSNLSYSPPSNRYRFVVRVPVVVGGAVKYVLSAAVNPESMSDLLSSQRLPRDWVGVILDGNHRFVARTLDPGHTMGQPASESLRAALAGSSEGWFRGTTIEGLEVYTPFNRSPFSGWTVAMGIPVKVVEAGSLRTIGTMTLGIASAGLVALLLAIVFGRRISLPIVSLATAAKAIGRGGRPEIAESSRIEEIIHLGRALEEASAAVGAREETQGWLAAIVESSEDAIVGKDLDGVITSWNPGAERLFGYRAEEIIGKPVTTLIPQGGEDEEAAILGRIRRGERIEHYEAVRRRKDGKLVDVSLTVSPIKDARGEIVGASKIARDITERKRVEEKLRQQTRSLEVIHRVGNALAAELDLNKIVQMVTDAGREISGAEFGAFFYKVQDERGESYLLYTLSGVAREAFEKFSMPRSTPLFEATLKGKGVVRIGDVLQDPRYGNNPPHYGMPKGHLPVRSYLAVPVVSRPGEVLGGLFFGHPEPQIFTAEIENILTAIVAQAAVAIDNANLYQALQRRVEEFQKLIDTAPVGIGVATDPECRHIWGNPVFSRMLGLDTGGNMSKTRSGGDRLPFKVFRGGREVPAEELPMQRACREEREVLDEELEIVREDGEVIHELCRATPLRDEHGKVRGCIGVFLDITERKEAEAALHEARDLLVKINEELETRVQERTGALLRTIAEREKLQEKLIQAQKMESIGTLAGGIAHDFNNILNIIQGYIFLLGKQAGEDEDVGESLKVIHQAVQRGTAVVQQLLTMARKREANLSLVDVKGVIRGLVQMIRETFPKNIEVTMDLASELPPLMADENQIHQALLNLCLNARDAMPEGGRLTIKTESIDGKELAERHPGADAERFVCIEVRDDGTGIEESIRNRVFEPFFSTKAESLGTGLGLAVVYGIVKDQRGFIDLESASGKGTSFRIYLPVRPVEALARVEEGPSEASVPPGPGDRDRGILVVEDEQAMRDLLCHHLSNNGYRVLTASDGEAAIETYRSYRSDIDVVLLDIGLPKISGAEALRKIRAEDPDARVVIASGYLDPELKSMLIREGVSCFIHKPYLLEEIVAALEF